MIKIHSIFQQFMVDKQHSFYGVMCFINNQTFVISLGYICLFHFTLLCALCVLLNGSCCNVESCVIILILFLSQKALVVLLYLWRVVLCAVT